MVNVCHRQHRKLHVSVFERNDFPANLQYFRTIHKKGYIQTKECSFAHRLLQTYNLAKQVAITCLLSRSFSVSVRVAVKHSTRSDGISQLRSKKFYLFCMCVCAIALVIRHAKRVLSLQHYIVVRRLSVCTIFFFLHFLLPGKIFGKKYLS